MNNRIAVGDKAPFRADTFVNLPTRRKFITKLLPGAFISGTGFMIEASQSPENTKKPSKSEINELLKAGVPIFSGLGLIAFAWSELILSVENKNKLLPKLDKLIPKVHEDFGNYIEL